MAKGKNAAALFEVIHTDRRFGKSAKPGEALRTPKWWFKKQPPPPPIDDSAAPQSDPALEPITPAAPDTPSAPPIDVALMPERQQISFRLTYSTAIIGGFSLLVVIILAYIVGRHMSAAPTPVASQSTAELLASPANEDVLNVTAPSRGGTTTAPPQPQTLMATAPAAVRATTPPAPAPVTGPVTRQVGLQYVIIQSYPHQEQDMAQAAAEFLQKNGVGVTVMKGLRGYTSWYVVVGTHGFKQTKGSPEYEQYRARIDAVGEAFAGSGKFKKFEPQLYTWRDQR